MKGEEFSNVRCSTHQLQALTSLACMCREMYLEAAGSVEHLSAEVAPMASIVLLYASCIARDVYLRTCRRITGWRCGKGAAAAVGDVATLTHGWGTARRHAWSGIEVDVGRKDEVVTTRA